MYARQAKGRELNFAVSGMLWQSSLVMIDEETQSLWSHLLGEAMQGPLQGTTLDVIPSAMSDWKSWKQNYPDTTVMIMTRTATGYRTDRHRNPGGLLIGLAEGELAKAWDLEGLKGEPVLNDHFGSRPVLLLFDQSSGTPFVYDRSVDEQLLQFDWLEGKLVDRETESHWDVFTGVALAGPLRGKRLARLPGIVSDHNAWFAFHRETELVLSNHETLAPEDAVP